MKADTSNNERGSWGDGGVDKDGRYVNVPRPWLSSISDLMVAFRSSPKKPTTGEAPIDKDFERVSTNERMEVYRQKHDEWQEAVRALDLTNYPAYKIVKARDGRFEIMMRVTPEPPVLNRILVSSYRTLLESILDIKPEARIDYENVLDSRTKKPVYFDDYLGAECFLQRYIETSKPDFKPREYLFDEDGKRILT